MKKYKYTITQQMVDAETNEILAENQTVSEGSSQTIVHSSTEIGKAVVHSFSIAFSNRLIDNQIKDKKSDAK